MQPMGRNCQIYHNGILPNMIRVLHFLTNAVFFKVLLGVG
ncbi:hypothetical protein LX69_02484 [Breznakibacter xylanolyticus]|uniref:Uncharacterized protein n=1 Tax=Breznakibacter xylanolyticus TaxID=990 RepID=A0A2W7NC52_9BACT|nr:hypothetical protein LX69_02484 [Breznakibacter xylanolyticus]